MAEVIVSGKSYQLNPAGPTLFGRRPKDSGAKQPDVELTGATSVSRSQCHVVATNGEFLLFDGWPNGKPSSNGTACRAGGRLVPVSADTGQGHRLADGDVIVVPSKVREGQRPLEIGVRLPEVGAGSDDATEFVDDSAPGLDDSTVYVDQDEDTVIPRPKAFLRVVQGLPRSAVPKIAFDKGVQIGSIAYKGKEFDITKANEVTLGRGSQCRVVVSDPDPGLAKQISRSHAEIVFDEADQGFHLVCRSPAGVEVNGKMVYDRVALGDRARIALGSTIIGFSVERKEFRRPPWYVRHEGLVRGLLGAAAAVFVLAVGALVYYRLTNRLPEEILQHRLWAEAAPVNQREAVTTAAVADLNGDGIPDIVYASGTDEFRRRAGSRVNGAVWALDGAIGGRLWNRPLESVDLQGGGTDRLGSVTGPIVTADLDGDSSPEVIVAAGNRIVVADGRTGNVRWYHDGAGRFVAGAAVADLDRNGIADVIAPMIDGTDTGKVVALRGDSGGVLWTTEGGGVTGTVPPAIADFNGDGVPDVIVANRFRGSLHAVDGRTGQSLWADEVYATSYPFPPLSAPAVGDLTGDGAPDVVVVTPDYQVVIIDGMTRSSRQVLLEGSMYLPAVVAARDFVTAPVLADVNGDGRLDIVTSHLGAVEGRSNQVYAIDGSAFEIIWKHYLDNRIAFAPPALVDMNRDGVPEIIVPEVPCVADVAPSADQAAIAAALPGRGVVEILDGRTGNAQARFDIQPLSGAFPPILQSTPVLADFDGNRRLDLVVGTTDGAINVLGLNVPAERYTIAWASQRGDASNRAVFAAVVRKTESWMLAAILGSLVFSILLLALSGGFVVLARRYRSAREDRDW